MAGSVNKVILVGNVGRDPEVRTTQDGRKIVNLSLATSESWTKDGVKHDRTEWHRIVCFNERLGEIIEKYVRKGSKIYVEGSLATRKWTDQAGVEKYSTEVILSAYRGEITMLSSGQPSAAPSQTTSSAPAATTAAPRDPIDDDIPF